MNLRTFSSFNRPLTPLLLQVLESSPSEKRLGEQLRRVCDGLTWRPRLRIGKLFYLANILDSERQWP